MWTHIFLVVFLLLHAMYSSNRLSFSIFLNRQHSWACSTCLATPVTEHNPASNGKDSKSYDLLLNITHKVAFQWDEWDFLKTVPTCCVGIFCTNTSIKTPWIHCFSKKSDIFPVHCGDHRYNMLLFTLVSNKTLHQCTLLSCLHFLGRSR